MIVPGTFIARDFSAIEAVITGYLCGSRRVTRLAKMGIHDWFMAHALLYPQGLITAADLPSTEWSDADLRASLKALKAKFAGDGGPMSPRQVAKRVIYLSMYAGTPSRMHEEYPDSFRTRRDASIQQAKLFELLPEIPAWHWRLCKEVDKSTVCKAPDGFIHRYYRVLAWKKIGDEWVPDMTDDAKRLISFQPQHMAAKIGKDAMRRVYYGEDGLRLATRINPRWRPVTPENWNLRTVFAHPYLRLFIHDEIFCECPVPLADDLDRALQAAMEVPCTDLPLDPAWEMGGCLTIGTEGKMGRIWSQMK